MNVWDQILDKMRTRIPEEDFRRWFGATAYASDSGDQLTIWVPSEATEALRDLERSRDDAKNAERVARHQLSKFLLRNERVFGEGRAWTQKYQQWLTKQK